MIPDVPRMGTIGRAATAGDPLPARHQVIYAIGTYLACHPIHLLAWTRDNSSPVEGAGGLGYEAGRRGVSFSTVDWRPTKSDQEVKVHSGNGCRNCPVGPTGKKRTGECENPLVYRSVDTMVIRWKEVADFVRPVLTQRAVAQMNEFMARRNAHIERGDKGIPEMPRGGDRDSAEYHAWQQAASKRTEEWLLLEREGHQMAEHLWDAAYDLYLMSTLMGTR